jgi:hypothetical protein
LSFLALPCVRSGAIGTASASQHLRVLATLGSLADIRKSVYPVIFGKSYDARSRVGGLQADLRNGRAVQERATGKGMPLRQHQTLGELVSIMTAQRGVCGPEDLISEERTRHEVRVDGRVLYTFCFVDAPCCPSCCGGAPVEVWSTSPDGEEVTGFVTRRSIRPRAGLDLGSRRGFGRRDLPLQRFASHEQREELP